MNFGLEDGSFFCFYSIERFKSGPKYRYVNNILIEYNLHNFSVEINFLKSERELGVELSSYFIEFLKKFKKIYFNEKIINVHIKEIEEKKVLKKDVNGNSYYSIETISPTESIKKIRDQLLKNNIKTQNTIRIELESEEYNYIDSLMIIYGKTKEEQYINEQKEWAYWEEN